MQADQQNLSLKVFVEVLYGCGLWQGVFPACATALVGGGLKMLDLKMPDMKLKDQCAGHEIAGRENDGPNDRT